MWTFVSRSRPLAFKAQSQSTVAHGALVGGVAVALALSCGIAPAQSGSAPSQNGKSADRESLWEVRLADRSKVHVRPITKDIEIKTRYGNLQVPIADVRRIEVGIRRSEEMEKRVAAAIDRLGDPNESVRDGAGRELIGLRERAYSALIRAARSENPEIKRRASRLADELSKKLGGRFSDRDVIVTPLFAMAGRIDEQDLKVESPTFGERKLQLGDLRQIKQLRPQAQTTEAVADEPPMPDESEQAKPRAEPRQFEARLADHSQVNVQVSTKDLDISTRYGKLKVPLAEVSRIDFRVRCAAGIEKRVRAAVARLGGDTMKERDDAGKELLELQEFAYAAVRQATKNADAEIRQRATLLMAELENRIPTGQLRDDDLIVTQEFTIAGQIEQDAVRANSAVFGEVSLQLTDLRQLRPASDGSDVPLLDRIKVAVGRGQTTRSQQVGSGKEPYEDIPKDGALVVGFDVSFGNFGGSSTIKSIRPIFLTSNGPKPGKTLDVEGTDMTHVLAKPGYAVGAVTVKAGAGVDGMSITFMEITDDGLNPKRAYESDWLGGAGGSELVKLGGTGAPIVGIFGKASGSPTGTFNGLGVVTANVKD